ncbi:MAG: hypothetical protein A2Y07_02585 [Planctomycetes bacterium GWF2_50_10]|nr:MAG: hypothetical protein A2Y07_02585 [Planctomycetes bacterium GWF2_50_10]
MAIIEVTNVNFSYDQAHILENLWLTVASGSFLAVAGPNGAGKSTLLYILAGLLKPASGSVSIESKPIGSYSFMDLARKIAFVRQEFVPAFGFTVEETVAMARAPYLQGFGFETPDDLAIVNEALEATETAQFAKRHLYQLSGGERQRVFVARALAQQTPILLLDEPMSFLDLKHQVDIYDLLKKMQTRLGKTILLISHDINVAAQYCDNILLLSADRKYHFGTAEEIFRPELIKEVFGVSGYAGSLGKERFFIPLGKFAKDAEISG